MKSAFFLFSVILFIIGLDSIAFAQENDTDICDVFSIDIKTEKETKLGSFTTEVSEGFSIHKTFGIPKTKLYLNVAVNYDDDLKSQKTGGLGDAIHLALLISSNKELTKKNFFNPRYIISFTETHFLYDDDLYPIDIMLMANTPYGKKSFYMTCKQNTRIK